MASKTNAWGYWDPTLLLTSVTPGRRPVFHMSFSFEPQLIKQDSAVPLRMMVGGWLVGIAAVIVVGPVANTLIALMGLTLVAGGLVALSLRGPRSWRMVLGATTGAVAAWLGFGFAFSERLIPARDDPFELFSQDHLAAVGLGLSVLSIGVGGLLESIRAQASPGSSPTLVRLLLIVIGMFIAGGACAAAGVSANISLLVTIAAAAGLAAMAWLRRERPTSDFVPRP